MVGGHVFDVHEDTKRGTEYRQRTGAKQKKARKIYADVCEESW